MVIHKLHETMASAIKLEQQLPLGNYHAQFVKIYQQSFWSWNFSSDSSSFKTNLTPLQVLRLNRTWTSLACVIAPQNDPRWRKSRITIFIRPPSLYSRPNMLPWFAWWGNCDPGLLMRPNRKQTEMLRSHWKAQRRSVPHNSCKAREYCSLCDTDSDGILSKSNVVWYREASVIVPSLTCQEILPVSVLDPMRMSGKRTHGFLGSISFKRVSVSGQYFNAIESLAIYSCTATIYPCQPTGILALLMSQKLHGVRCCSQLIYSISRWKLKHTRGCLVGR